MLNLNYRYTRPVSSKELEIIELIDKQFLGIDGLINSSVTYDNGILYFALYFMCNLKITFSYYIEGYNDLIVTFSNSADRSIIRMEKFDSIETLIRIIKTIMERILSKSIDECNTYSDVTNAF